jgi:hypothetical protein
MWYAQWPAGGPLPIRRHGGPHHEFASGSWFDASDDELRAAASGYIAYSGPFHVDEKGTVTHRLGSLCTRTGSGSPSPE